MTTLAWLLATRILLAADPPAPAGAPADPAATAPADGDDAFRPEVTASGFDGAAEDSLRVDDWQRDDWMLVRPKVALLELGGYFRARSFRLGRLDFGVGSSAATEVDTEGQPLQRYPAIGGGANFSATTMRLRLEPRINVNPRAHVTATLDLLDNIVLGSTPDTQLMRPPTRRPPDILASSQLYPRRALTAWNDSVVVKRLWARVTAFDEQVELRIGRVPDHFGLGMMYNDGDGLDADYGTVADRIALSVRLFDHLFVPMIDWVGRGPGLRPFGASDPAGIDASGLDDAIGYGFRIIRQDHPEEVREHLAHGRQVLNYGTAHTFRTQSQAFPKTTVDGLVSGGALDGGPTNPTAGLQLEPRDAFLYIGDVFAVWARGPWEVRAEVALQSGHFNDMDVVANASPLRYSVLRGGGLLEGRWRQHLDGRGLSLGLRAGGASGDGHAGMGALDQADTQRGGSDLSLNNFQFSPDYHVDLLFFRRIVGTVTDALFLRPEATYRFNEQVEGSLQVIYSQAIDAASTPSAASGQGARPLALEVDGGLRLGPVLELPQGAVLAAVQGGMVFPLGAFEVANTSRSTTFAWTLQGRLWLTF